MRCKSCRREIVKNSLYCSWCGKQQISLVNAPAVPRPKRLKDGSYSAQMMVNGLRLRVKGETEEEYYASAVALKAKAIEAKKPCNLLVGDCLESYIAQRSNIVSPSTYRDYRQKQLHHFTDLQKLKISELTLYVLQSAVNDEAAHYSAKTVSNAWGLVSAAIRPFTDIALSDVTMPKKNRPNVSVYDDDELARLFASVRGDSIELAVYLAACLGLRRSEILALTSSSFSRKDHTVTICQARVPDADNNLVVKGTKTDKSNRVLSCPDFIFDLVPDTGDDYIYGKFKQNYILNRLKRICAREGLPNITLHGLRHSNASVMLRIMPDKYAMARGGWSTNWTMKEIYQHTISKEQERYDEQLNRHFEKLLITSGLLADDENH